MAYGTMGGEGQPQTQAAIFTRYARFGVRPAGGDQPPRAGCSAAPGARTATTLKTRGSLRARSLSSDSAPPATMSSCCPPSPRRWATPARSSAIPTACSKARPIRAATARWRHGERRRPRGRALRRTRRRALQRRARHAVPRLSDARPSRATQEAIAGWMREAGMTVRIDAAANLIGRYEGSDRDAPAAADRQPHRQRPRRRALRRAARRDARHRMRRGAECGGPAPALRDRGDRLRRRGRLALPRRDADQPRGRGHARRRGRSHGGRRGRA